jgi:spermidine synthase/Fe-S-cluster containining protein
MLRSLRRVVGAAARRSSSRRGAAGERVLNFACTRCGKCCHVGEERRVFVSAEEVGALARHTALPPSAFLAPQEPTDTRRFLQKSGDGRCVFLQGKECSVHALRPTSCATYPYWSEIVSPLGWLRESARCEGISRDAPAVPHDEVALHAVLTDLSLDPAHCGTFDASLALLRALPLSVVEAHYAELAKLGGVVRCEDDVLCVIDAPRDDDGRTTRTLVLKSAPALDQSVSLLTHDGARVSPGELVMPVHRLLTVSLLLLRRPALRVCIIGGGGCAIPAALASVAPGTRITVVELSPAVARAARNWFLPAADTSSSIELVVADGAAFLRDCADSFDVIILDAAAAATSPAPELATPAFLDCVRARLAVGGIFAANTFGDAAVASFERATSRVFACGAAVELPSGDAQAAHTVIFAEKREDAAVEEWRAWLAAGGGGGALAALAGGDMLQHAARALRRV